MQGSNTILGFSKRGPWTSSNQGTYYKCKFLGPLPNYYGNSGHGAQQSVLTNPQVILVLKSENHCAILFYHKSTISDKLVLIQTLTEAYTLHKVLSR